MSDFSGGVRPPESPWTRRVAPRSFSPPQAEIPDGQATSRNLLRDAAAWCGIMLLIVVGYGFRHELADAGNRVLAVFIPSYGYSSNPETISFSAASDGHYWVNARVDGVGFRFMVDTGASSVVLSKEDVRRLGIDPAALRYERTVETANGAIKAASIRLRELAIGPIVIKDVPALVNATPLSEPLLGMRLLERLSAVEIKDGTLTLRR
jgi:aspartyl protease family protein